MYSKYVLGIVCSVVLTACIITGCAPGPTPGEKAQDFTLNTVAGESFTLEDHLGRPIVLSFFTATCPACRPLIAPLNELHAKYRDTKNLLVLGVGIGSLEAITTYVQERGITYPVVVDSNRVVSRLYGVSGIPHTFFINRRGMIVSEHLGFLSVEGFESRLAMIW